MPIRNAVPVSFRAIGVTDSTDGSNSQPGSLAALSNLVHNEATPNTFVPRPGIGNLSTWPGLGTVTRMAALIVVGTKAFGLLSSNVFAGKDIPFCYDLVANALIAITGATSANTPTSASAAGDWTPPQMVMIGTGRIMISHTGYAGGAVKVGFIDVSSFSSATITGTTAIGSPVITALTGNPILAGWQVGHTITGAGIPAGSLILSMTATTVTISANCTAAAAVLLTVAGGTPAAPRYGAGDTNTVNLAAVPQAVGQFNGRAWYAVGNVVVFSDSLNPMQVSLATQALTVGDNQNVTAFGGLPLANAVVGGVSQSLIAFKSAAAVFQITGDQATSDLKLDAIAGGVGTLAPNSICATPRGLAYIAPDGVRFINADGVVLPPVGRDGSGVTTPFRNAVYPTRMTAAFNGEILRCTCQNGFAAGSPYQEWWYDVSSDNWTGPHTVTHYMIEAYTASMIQPYVGGSATLFVGAVNESPTFFYVSACYPNSNSIYTEFGVPFTFSYQTTLLPDNGAMAANAMIESTQMLQLPTTQSLTITMRDESDTVLDTATIAGPGSGVGPFKQYRIPWTIPLVFKQASYKVTGTSLANTIIGNPYFETQPLGYLVA